ncbi:MAG: endonuclease III [Clostridia bacterium]|nr:endonuclease III [Clostridia bacterium]
MERYEIVTSELQKIFVDAKCELDYKDPYTLLVAVILSAQCTDKRVNLVTPTLFASYPNVYAMANAEQADIERIIHSCGFYRNKAKSIIECSKDIIAKHNGEVPNTLEELVELRGVGRKTANVVLSTIFNVPAIAVDTHVFRVSNRLGLANAKTPEECEKQLMENLPKELWSKMHQLLVLFGRYNCKSKNPSCESCSLKGICKEYKCKKN